MDFFGVDLCLLQFFNYVCHCVEKWRIHFFIIRHKHHLNISIIYKICGVKQTP